MGLSDLFPIVAALQGNGQRARRGAQVDRELEMREQALPLTLSTLGAQLDDIKSATAAREKANTRAEALYAKQQADDIALEAELGAGWKAKFIKSQLPGLFGEEGGAMATSSDAKQVVTGDLIRQTLFGKQPAALQGMGIPSMDFSGRTNAGDRGLTDLLSSMRPASRTRLAAATDAGLDPAGEDLLAALLKANGGTLQPELASQLAQQIAGMQAMSSKPSALADILFGPGGALAPVEPRQSGRNLNLPPGFLESARGR